MEKQEDPDEVYTYKKYIYIYINMYHPVYVEYLCREARGLRRDHSVYVCVSLSLSFSLDHEISRSLCHFLLSSCSKVCIYVASKRS